jgi:hypothetical protein
MKNTLFTRDTFVAIDRNRDCQNFIMYYIDRVHAASCDVHDDEGDAK